MKQKELFRKDGMRILTHSATECFQECRVKWDYRYNREIVTTEPQTALDFGTAIHTGLETGFVMASTKPPLKLVSAEAQNWD